MKQVNKRKKAWAGTATAIASIIGALTSAGSAIYNGVQNARNAAELRRKENLVNNLNNSMAFTENQLQAANYGQNEELATNRFNELTTLNSAMRCGGKKRMKRAGGNVIADISKLGLYI